MKAPGQLPSLSPLDPALITGGVARNSQWRAFRVGAYDEMAKASRG